MIYWNTCETRTMYSWPFAKMFNSGQSRYRRGQFTKGAVVNLEVVKLAVVELAVVKLEVVKL